jgi:zinc/manganese transport system permease protein
VDVELSIVLPALLAGLLISASHVPLGMQVLDRGIVFVDIAIAQIAGVGVVAADLFGFADAGSWAVQAAALGAALLGAALLTWTDRRWPAIQEALIGTIFVLAATAQILLLAGNPHGGEYLRDLLVGQILWVTTDQLLVASALTAVVLGLWFGVGRERLGPMGFYALFGLAVTASVQLVGVYLVFATLIVPALASRDARPGRLACAYAVAVLGYVAGLVASVVFDLPTGPVVVWAMAFVGVLFAWWLAAGRGASGVRSRTHPEG